MIDSPDAIFYLYKVKSSNHNRLLLSFSERAGIRTPDNLIKSQVLYHLSYTPIINWASWIRTNECRSQSPVPYRLAIAHHFDQ